MDRARAAEASAASTCTPSAPEAELPGASERRLRKWRKMLGTGVADWREFVRRHPQKLKRRVRKGSVPLPPSTSVHRIRTPIRTPRVRDIPTLLTTRLVAPTGEL
jgi:hypothetical protein